MKNRCGKAAFHDRAPSNWTGLPIEQPSTQKNPDSLRRPGFAVALAALLTRPQAELQIGADSKLLWPRAVVKFERVPGRSRPALMQASITEIFLILLQS
jgi:hypothetical protein